MANMVSKSMTLLKVLGGIAAAYQTIRILGDATYRTQIKQDILEKLSLGNSEKSVGLIIKENAQKLYGNIMMREGLGVKIKENVQLALGNIYEKTSTLFKQTGLIVGAQRLAISIQESLIKAKDFVVEQASLGLTLAKNAATLIYNGILSIGNAIKKSGLLASIAEMAMSAFASLSKIPFIGPILGIAGAAAAAGLGYMYYNKADDMVSPGANSAGYGSRTLMGPEGAIALNNKDTVIAGTNLFPKGDDVVSKPAGAVNMVQDNSRMEKLLERAVNRPDPVIKMNGERLGTAVGKYAYSAQ